MQGTVNLNKIYINKYRSANKNSSENNLLLYMTNFILLIINLLQIKKPLKSGLNTFINCSYLFKRKGKTNRYRI